MRSSEALLEAFGDANSPNKEKALELQQLKQQTYVFRKLLTSVQNTFYLAFRAPPRISLLLIFKMSRFILLEEPVYFFVYNCMLTSRTY